jgi:hypothetical protein
MILKASDLAIGATFKGAIICEESPQLIKAMTYKYSPHVQRI